MNLQRVQTAMIKRAGVLADIGSAGLTAANGLTGDVASMFKSPPRTATSDQINDAVLNYVRNNTSPETLADFRRNFNIAPEVDDATVLNYWADRYKNRMQPQYDNYFKRSRPGDARNFDNRINNWVKQNPMMPYRYNFEKDDFIKPEHRIQSLTPKPEPKSNTGGFRGHGATGSW